MPTVRAEGEWRGEVVGRRRDGTPFPEELTWPRESTAGEIATALDISAPTLHGHLRKAEHALLAELFDRGPPDRG